MRELPRAPRWDSWKSVSGFRAPPASFHGRRTRRPSRSRTRTACTREKRSATPRSDLKLATCTVPPTNGMLCTRELHTCAIVWTARGDEETRKRCSIVVGSAERAVGETGMWGVDDAGGTSEASRTGPLAFRPPLCLPVSAKPSRSPALARPPALPPPPFTSPRSPGPPCCSSLSSVGVRCVVQLERNKNRGAAGGARQARVQRGREGGGAARQGPG